MYLYCEQQLIMCHDSPATASHLQTMGREHKDMDVPALIQKLKKTHRWHVETA